MKILCLMFFFFSLNSYACSIDELAIKAEPEISKFAKSMGAATYVSGPGFLAGQEMHFPFSFVDKSDLLQIGVLYANLTTCEISGLGYGSASEKNVR